MIKIKSPEKIKRCTLQWIKLQYHATYAMGFSEILYDKTWKCKRLSQESCEVRQEVDVTSRGQQHDL